MAMKKHEGQPLEPAVPDAGGEGVSAVAATAAPEHDAGGDGEEPAREAGDDVEAGRPEAVATGDASAAAPAASERDGAGSRAPRSAPVWVLALYLGGIAVVFLGQRVLDSWGSVATAVTVVGLLAVISATLLRYSPRFRVGGERRQIEALLGVLSITGLVALGIYFATSEPFAERLGLYRLGDRAFDRVMGVATVTWVALAVLSVVPMIFAETAAFPMRHAVRPESRRVRAAAVAGVTLALAAVYGSLFVYAARGLAWSADHSYFKTSQPSGSTRAIIASLSEPVRVQAFFPDVNEVRAEVERYLTAAAAGNPKLEVEIKDRLLVPEAAQKLRVTQDGVLVITQGEASEQVRLGTELDKARPKLRTLDRDFQEKLLKLVRSRRTAYLTVGHGEINDTVGKAEMATRDATIVDKLLTRQNYTVKTLGIAQGLGTDIPADADIVLVLGPSEPFAAEEIGALRRYAERGGKLFLALDPDAETNTEALLPSDRSRGDLDVSEPAGASPDRVPAAVGSAAPATSAAPVASAVPTAGTASPAAVVPPRRSWLGELAGVVGLTFDDAVLANDKVHMRVRSHPSDRARLVTNRFSSHAAVSTLSRSSTRGAAVMVDGAGSLDRAPGADATIDFALKSMPDTYRDLDRNYRFDSASEQRETYNLAAAVSRRVKSAPPTPAASASAAAGAPEGSAPRSGQDGGAAKNPADGELRAFVLADSGALTDLPMGNVIENQILFVDALRWLTGEESFMGEISSEEDLRVEHTRAQDLVWFYSTIFGVPALVLGAGLLLGRRRQPKGVA